MIKSLSILIPTFNDECYGLARDLQAQASDVSGLRFEIIVGDDCSTAPNVREANSEISALPHCRIIWLEQNVGRSAIRNLLAREATGEWLLFIDADMGIPSPDFIKAYADAATMDAVIYGGYILPESDNSPHRGAGGAEGLLRYRYERSRSSNRSASERNLRPYADFHTSNFLIRRDTFLASPLSEEIRNYGYEDVLFGRQLEARGVEIIHVDNPVLFSNFESNKAFLAKTEEGLRTLHQFRPELEGYSRLLAAVGKLERLRIARPLAALISPLMPLLRHATATGRAPLFLFSIYRLAYFLNIREA